MCVVHWSFGINKSYTVKHVYSDHTYNEMTLITKHFEIPDKHFIYLEILHLQRSCI